MGERDAALGQARGALRPGAERPSRGGWSPRETQRENGGRAEFEVSAL